MVQIDTMCNFACGGSDFSDGPVMAAEATVAMATGLPNGDGDDHRDEPNDPPRPQQDADAEEQELQHNRNKTKLINMSSKDLVIICGHIDSKTLNPFALKALQGPAQRAIPKDPMVFIIEHCTNMDPCGVMGNQLGNDPHVLNC